MEHKEPLETKSIDAIIEDFLAYMKGREYITDADLPNIDLYMDQVTTFMDSRLAQSKRYESDKILTKTMINNYAKNRLLPPPEKKKYSKDHMYLLLFIYYLKNILSINDIQKLLTPLTDRYFHASEGLSFADIYGRVLSMFKNQIDRLDKDIRQAGDEAASLFGGTGEDEDGQLRLFATVSLLSLDVYFKKQLIEKLIDQFPFPEKDEKKR